MDKNELEKRIADLQAKRERLAGELDKARTEARDAMIAGQKPGGAAAALAERITIVDDALAELQDRTRSAAESAERNNRRRRAETALDATSKRAKLAVAVDEALNTLASSWDAYADALRKDVGQVSGAGGDLTAVERALTNNRTAEPLVKALIQSGGVKLARTFGIDTPIRERHAISLTDAVNRVAEKRADIFYTPNRRSRTELERFWEPAFFHSLPPGRLGNGNWAVGCKYLRQADKACAWKIWVVHCSSPERICIQGNPAKFDDEGVGTPAFPEDSRSTCLLPNSFDRPEPQPHLATF